MNFSFYTVDPAYCDYLRKTDPRVPYTMDKKSIRPFVGIVFTVNDFHYYAPLTSPKPKPNQLSWCNSHKEIILRQAEKLYHTIVQGNAWEGLAYRCCNFILDEQKCLYFEK